MTKIVNIRKKKGQRKSLYEVLIDRTTIFGNHHKIGYCSLCNKIHDRKDSIEMYKKDFYKRVLTDIKFRDNILSLKGKILGCWCSPLACHGDVIVEYLEKPVWGIEKVYDGCMGGVNLEEW